MKTAIISGASSGLGAEYLSSVINLFPDIKEIWLIARRKERLEELSANYPKISIKIFPLDLTDTASFSVLENSLKESKPDVRILINNAGCGKLGYFSDTPTHEHAKITDLNVRAATLLPATVIPYMSEGSFIVNVCSISSFVPNARLAVYSSSKAYLFSLSKVLRQELKSRKINSLAVCPGPMFTEFLSVAEIHPDNSKTFATLPYCKAPEVARRSLIYASRGKAVYTNKPFYKFYRMLAKLLPHSLVMKLSKA